jgi:S-disulfanyl-L-cysteine oxidoreductase SoxD
MVAVLLMAAGCGAVVPATVVPYSGGPEGPTDPASRGEEVYAGACAGCHGERGEGSEGRPALIGDKALPVEPVPGASARKAALTTAQDLFAFIKSDMPPIAPGSLDDDQYWAVVTYLVKANGVEHQRQGIDSTNAGSIKLHR